MKAMLTTAAAIALAGLFAAPATAQDASKDIAAKHSGGQCAISQAMLQAIADNEQNHQQATKTRIDQLIEGALASSRAAKPGSSPVIMGKRPADG